MKILFIHKQTFMFFGILSLSGYLKKFGHQTDILIASKEKDIIKKIYTINPDIIGFSVMSNDHQWFADTSLKIKKVFSEIPIIVGGVHTYLCNDLINLPQIDFVCIGEGEKPLLELLNRLDKNENFFDIKSLYIKHDNIIYKNEIGLPLAELDDINDDREIYLNRYPFFKNEKLLQIVSSRGCPFKCSFCINPAIYETYGAIIKNHRQKSARKIVNELKKSLHLFPKTTTIFFADDLFLSNKKFAFEFTELYKNEIKIPYMMNVFPFFIDDTIAKALADSGCSTVMVSPETGNENHRFNIFNKPIKNESFIKMSELVKKYGIKIYVNVMFVYPEQTTEDVYKTIELNHAMKTDFPFKSFLLTYPNTKIFDIAVKGNYISEKFSFSDLPVSYFTNSPLNHPQKKEITLIFYFYYFLVKLPFLYKLIKCRLWILKLIPFKKYISYLGIYLWFKNWKNMDYLTALFYIWRFRNDK